MRQEFPKSEKLARWQHAKGCCESCSVKIRAGLGPHYDHEIPDNLGGQPTFENCRVLCKTCHGIKTSNTDRPAIDKARRVLERSIGARDRKGKPMPGTKRSGWKHKMSGEWEKRNG